MKSTTKTFIVSFCLVIGLFVLDEELKMRNRIRRGQIVYANPSKGVFAGGPVIIDKVDRTITSRATMFPVILWTDASGTIKSRRHFVQSRVGISVDIPASKEEVAFYHAYFPES